MIVKDLLKLKGDIMNSIILDCSSGMSLYVLSGEKIFSSIDKSQKKHTDELLLALDKLLVEASISIKKIDNICVCIGPGSFTGIRVAVSICKGLAIGTGAKVFTCSNFDSISFGETENTVYLLDAFSDYIYVREFYKGIAKDYCIKLSEFLNNIPVGCKIVVGSEKLQNALKNYEIYTENAENNVIKLFKEKIIKGENIELSAIEPIYLRASQAEIEREKKLSGEDNGKT